MSFARKFTFGVFAATLLLTGCEKKEETAPAVEAPAPEPEAAPAPAETTAPAAATAATAPADATAPAQ